MKPPPTAIGLTICEKAIVEEHSRNVSLISTFTKLNVKDLARPPAFCIYALLTDGSGPVTITLRGVHLDDHEEVYARQVVQVFPDPLAEVGILFRLNEFAFPRPGKYQFILLADGEWVAHRTLIVTQRDS